MFWFPTSRRVWTPRDQFSRQVSRLGKEFPLAEEHTGGKKKITVFCSNDYLGMSWHPEVQAAVM